MPTFPVIDPDRVAAVERQFYANFEAYDELGASVSVWQGERELLSLAHGSRERTGDRAWTEETLVPVWSCSKGPAVAACLLALDQNGIALDAPVAGVWPEFSRAGKRAIRIGDLLSHQAGLAALADPSVPITDYRAVIQALESQERLWDAGHGYHPRTYGFLLDELVRRVTGAESLGAYWREELADPLGLDVWIGLPEAEHSRVALVYPGRGPLAQSDEEARFYRAFADPASLTARAFASPRGLRSVGEMNQPAVWSAGYPAMGGVASATGLAGFYAFLAGGGVCAGRTFYGAAMLAQMETGVVQGDDRVLLRETAFGPGFMKDPLDGEGKKRRQLFGPNCRAFGHPGAGGSLAFADPDTGIGFAYVMNQMERSVFPTAKALGLVRSLYASA